MREYFHITNFLVFSLKFCCNSNDKCEKQFGFVSVCNQTKPVWPEGLNIQHDSTITHTTHIRAIFQYPLHRIHITHTPYRHSLALALTVCCESLLFRVFVCKKKNTTFHHGTKLNKQPLRLFIGRFDDIMKTIFFNERKMKFRRSERKKERNDHNQ